jgi:protein TonB
MEDLAAPAYPIGKDVSAPHLVSKVERAYTEEARNGKLSGTVLLSLIVDTDGVPQNIKVVRPLGMGLDEKAIEAVEQWRFKPGVKNGEPVPVKAQVAVSFRLYTNPPFQ